MKRIKLVSCMLCVVMLCGVLTGCVGLVNKTTVNEDGSGTFVSSVGYTKAGLEALSSFGSSFGEGESDIDISSLTPFTHNGITYYGVQATESFNSCEEFNKKFVEAMNNEENGTSMAEDFCVMTQKDDGSFVLKFGGEVNDTSEDAMMDQASGGMEMDVESQAALEEMVKEMAMVFEFSFPYPVTQTSAEKVDGVVINGNVVTLDLIKISTAFTEMGKTEAWVEFVASKSQPEAPKYLFDDVLYGTWYFDAIDYLTAQGLVAGNGDGTFNPNGALTYAEFCQIIARADGAETGALNGYWAGKAIQHCKEWNFIKDLGPITAANYDVPISREVAVSGVYRLTRTFLPEKNTSITEYSIPDYFSIDEDYRNDILFAYQTGLSHGSDSNGTFNPKSTLTRAEICQLFYNSGFQLKN